MNEHQRAAIVSWPEEHGTVLQGALSIPTLAVDLRTFRPQAGIVAELTNLTHWCIRNLAALTPAPAAAAVVVRHRPAASGRVSDSLFAEAALCGLRALVRQLRYDRSWLQTSLIFTDAGLSTDQEIASLLSALASGGNRLEVERSSGVTVAAAWKRGQSL
jgi:hypothetical protein